MAMETAVVATSDTALPVSGGTQRPWSLLMDVRLSTFFAPGMALALAPMKTEENKTEQTSSLRFQLLFVLSCLLTSSTTLYTAVMSFEILFPFGRGVVHSLV